VRFRTALLLCSFFLGCFTVAAWSAPSPAPAVSGAASAKTQSVDGKISSIGDAEFTLDVTKSQDSSSNTLQFLVDGNTKVEGKLAVGAQATVEYRASEGKYIATLVVVTPSSGMSL
jgi:Domain of unknown function (DUF5666)